RVTPHKNGAHLAVVVTSCRLGTWAAPGLELRDFRKVEVSYLHRWHYHVQGFFSGGADGLTHGHNVLEHVDQALVEAEVTKSRPYFAVFNLEGTIAGHARDDLLVRVDLADIPKASYKNAPLG